MNLEQPKSPILYLDWTLIPILTGISLIVADLLIDPLKLGTSDTFGPRQIAILVVGSLLLIIGTLANRVKGLRLKIEFYFERFNQWLYTGDHTNYKFWITAFSLSLLLFTLFLIFFYKRYDYLDDTPIRDSIKAGVALLFSANLFLEVVNFFYITWPSFPWYGIFLYLSTVGTFTIIIFLVIKHPMPWRERVVYMILLISMYIPFWVRAGYNYASSLPSGIAIIGLSTSWRGNKKPSIWISFLWGILLAISFIFRRDGPKIGLLYIAPPVLAFLALQIILSRPKIGTLFRFTVAGIAFLLPYTAIQVIDEYQYQNVLTWQEQFHRTSNRSRSAYYGQKQLLSAILRNNTLLKANGWNENDVIIAEYAMVLFDENKFAAEQFYRIFDSEIGIPQSESRQGLSGAIENLKEFGQKDDFIWYNPGWIEWNERWYYYPYYLGMIAMVLFVVWRGERYYDKLFAIGFLIYVYFVSTYMLNYMKLPRHVAVPPMVLFYIAILFSPNINYPKQLIGWHRKSFIILVALVFLASFIGFIHLNYESDKEIPLKRTRFLNLYRDMAGRFGSDAFIFVRPPLYIDYFVDPLGDQGPSTHQAFMNVSSTAYSPIYYNFLRSKGLDYGYQLLPWMVDNPKAYLAGTQPRLIDRIRRFINETYGIEVEIQPVYTYSNGFVIYRLVSVNKSPIRFNTTVDLVDELQQAQIQAPTSEYVHSGMVTIGRYTREIIFQHPPSQIQYPVFIPPSGRLSFGIGISPEAWQTDHPIGDGVTFRIYVDQSTSRNLVFERYIDPKTYPEDQHWFDFDLSLEKWSGQNVHLILETDPGKNMNDLNDWSVWAEPKIGEWSYFSFTNKFYMAFPTPARINVLQVRRIKVNNSYQDAIFQHPDQQIHFPVTIEPNTNLTFFIGLDPAVWNNNNRGDGVEFRLKVDTGNDETIEIFSKYIDPKNNIEDRQWFFESVDLSDFSGKSVEIIFETNSGPHGDMSYDWAYWISPNLVKQTVQPSTP